ncbi:MAG: cell division protein ZipA C-terminal FtsZ-binding domain-containing protein [Gammaproteobacteria bacterium]|nr:cell division protein ZipA C-terminal FtsZ-binding domain-containing protein [Gammaproteobacteria bacterium]
MDQLRWILLGLGALVIVGVYVHGSWQTIREKGWPQWPRKSAESSDRIEPDALYGDDGVIGEVKVTRIDEPEPEREPELESEPEWELDLGLEDDVEIAPELTPEEGSAVPEGEQKVVVLTVMAPKGVQYAGDALAEVAETCGLKLTDQGVFRRGVDTDSGTVAAYTIANILEPGTFEQSKLAEQMTPGVVMIMQLPGPFDGPSTFEQMLATARTIVERLGGQLLDGRRCDLNSQSIEHMREELLEYRRRSQLADRRSP